MARGKVILTKTIIKTTKKKKDLVPRHPSYLDMVREAILALNTRNGSTRQAIKKYILATYKLPDNTITAHYLRSAINKGFDEEIFAFPNGPSSTVKLTKKGKRA